MLKKHHKEHEKMSFEGKGDAGEIRIYDGATVKSVTLELGMVADIYKPSAQESEAEECHEFMVRINYTLYD